MWDIIRHIDSIACLHFPSDPSELESSQDCVSREEKGSSLAETVFLIASGCFHRFTLFPATVEMLNDTPTGNLHCLPFWWSN